MRAPQISGSFSGHRPEKLPWGDNERDERCLALKDAIRQMVEKAYADGYRHFICGMARGCDQYFAEAVLAARADGAQDAQLCALVPCPSQPDGWDEASVARYWALLAACDQLEVLEDHYSPGCMLRRNREMLRRAQLLISVYDGCPSGTAATVRLADELGITVLPLWM